MPIICQLILGVLWHPPPTVSKPGEKHQIFQLAGFPGHLGNSCSDFRLISSSPMTKTHSGFRKPFGDKIWPCCVFCHLIPGAFFHMKPFPRPWETGVNLGPNWMKPNFSKCRIYLSYVVANAPEHVLFKNFALNHPSKARYYYYTHFTDTEAKATWSVKETSGICYPMILLPETMAFTTKKMTFDLLMENTFLPLPFLSSEYFYSSNRKGPLALHLDPGPLIHTKKGNLNI